LRMDHLVQRRVDASDIVQDVLIEAHRRHRVAARRSVDREQPLVAAAHLDLSTYNLAAGIVDPELTPAAAATWHELQIRFQQALDTMDEQDREVVLLRHFEHLSNGEVAEVLGLSEPTAGMRYLRAMRRLRTKLEISVNEVPNDE
jgi:RNA polymerase sigma-70 factor (ECF subfamily)